MSRGVLTIHSVTRALAPHIEWAVNGVLGAPARWVWEKQPLSPAHVRAVVMYTAVEAVGAELATSLRGWDHLYFEITEEPTAHESGSRWMYTPALGIHHSSMDAAGNVTLTEDRIRAAVRAGGSSSRAIIGELGKALGEAWDEELERFRVAGECGLTPRLHLVS